MMQTVTLTRPANSRAYRKFATCRGFAVGG